MSARSSFVQGPHSLTPAQFFTIVSNAHIPSLLFLGPPFDEYVKLMGPVRVFRQVIFFILQFFRQVIIRLNVSFLSFGDKSLATPLQTSFSRFPRVGLGGTEANGGGSDLKSLQSTQMYI